jgi:NADH:ubiquinone oxidoreductase subunit 3 (subunit A)
MIREYLPILLQAAVAIGFAVSALVVSVLLGKSGVRTRRRIPPTNAGC